MAYLRVPFHLDEHLRDLNLPVPDGAEVTEIRPELPESDVWARMVALYDQVAQAIASAARAGSIPTVVSGDCTVTIGMAAGLQRAGVDPAVVWIDAHGDLQTLETTSSGYLGGMALRFLLGYRFEAIAGPLGLRPPAEDRVVLLDARDLDSAEQKHLDSTSLRRFVLADFTSGDLPPGPLLVNLDLDTLDPAERLDARYQAEGGPDLTAILRAVGTIRATGRLASLNIACTWNPGVPDTEAARRHALTAIYEALR